MSTTPDQKEHKLEAMLQARRIEPASPDLVERIVHKAHFLAQQRPVSLLQWVKGVFTEFHLPRPAYVFASALLFGVIVGFTVPQSPPSVNDGDSVAVQSFLYVDEDFL